MKCLNLQVSKRYHRKQDNVSSEKCVGIRGILMTIFKCISYFMITLEVLPDKKAPKSITRNIYILTENWAASVSKLVT